MKKSPSAFRGPLSLAQIAAGMEHARKNSLRLCDDARMMLAAERYPTAFALAALAIEELGKIPILRQMIDADAAEMKRLWRDFTQHTAKNLIWPVMNLAHDRIARSGSVRLEHLRPAYDPDASHPKELDRNKQLATYTECVDRGSWSVPDEYIGFPEAQELVRIATNLMAGVRHRAFTRRELELWREAFGSTPEKKVVSWYAAMQAEGLAPAGVNLMDHFINVGLGGDVGARSSDELLSQLRAALKKEREK